MSAGITDGVNSATFLRWEGEIDPAGYQTEMYTEIGTTWPLPRASIFKDDRSKLRATKETRTRTICVSK